MAVTACVFCGRTPPEVKITKEHVLGRWLRKALPHARPIAAYEAGDTGSHARMGGATAHFTSRRGPPSPFDDQVRVVCDRCNHEWLNDLIETRGRRAAEPVILGARTRLTFPQRHAFATWAFEAALMRDFIDDEHRRAVHASELQWLYQHRRPHPGTYVFAGRCAPEPDYDGRVHWLTLSLGSAEDHQPGVHPRAPNAHFSAWYLGHLIVAVFGTRQPELGGHRLARGLANEVDLAQVWPIARGGSALALPGGLTRHDFDVLTPILLSAVRTATTAHF